MTLLLARPDLDGDEVEPLRGDPPLTWADPWANAEVLDR
jgi:hypothetical protein